MNIRTHMVQIVPMASTAAAYAAVTLPCEPWNKPNIPVVKPLNQTVAANMRREDAAGRIIGALRKGHTQFDQIMNSAFGKRSGPIDDLGRLVLGKLLADGQVTRERSTLPGLPFIWNIADE